MGTTTENVQLGFRWGVVCTTNPEKCRVRVRLPDLDDVVTGELWVIQPFTYGDKSYKIPDIDQQVLCLFMGNGVEAGMVMGGNYNDQDLPPVTSQNKHHVAYKDGTWFEYDRAAHTLSAQVQGDINIAATGHIAIKAGGKVTINGQEIHLN